MLGAGPGGTLVNDPPDGATQWSGPGAAARLQTPSKSDKDEKHDMHANTG